MEQRVTALHARSGRRVAIVGHSRGCHLAASSQRAPPERVSHGVLLGADAAARLTSIYSKGYGVVHWQAQLVPMRTASRWPGATRA